MTLKSDDGQQIFQVNSISSYTILLKSNSTEEEFGETQH